MPSLYRGRNSTVARAPSTKFPQTLSARHRNHRSSRTGEEPTKSVLARTCVEPKAQRRLAVSLCEIFGTPRYRQPRTERLRFHLSIAGCGHADSSFCDWCGVSCSQVGRLCESVGTPRYRQPRTERLRFHLSIAGCGHADSSFCDWCGVSCSQVG